MSAAECEKFKDAQMPGDSPGSAPNCGHAVDNPIKLSVWCGDTLAYQECVNHGCGYDPSSDDDCRVQDDGFCCRDHSVATNTVHISDCR